MLALSLNILLAASVLVKSAPAEQVLPAPSLGVLELIDPAGLIVNWKPIKSGQERMLGYKVKLWEAKDIEIYRFKLVNGTEVLVKEKEKPKLQDFRSQDGKLHEYRVTGAQHSRLVVNGLQFDSPYLLQVLAFSARGDGEPSSVLGLQITGNQGNHTVT